MKGTVRRFYFRKGFGFIEGEPGTEYFFHYSEFTGEKRLIQPGLEVEFETRQGDKGLAATAVRALGAPAPRTPSDTPRRSASTGAPGRAAGRAPSRAQPPVVAKTPSRAPWTLPFGAGVAVGAVLGIGTYVLIASGG